MKENLFLAFLCASFSFCLLQTVRKGINSNWDFFFQHHFYVLDVVLFRHGANKLLLATVERKLISSDKAATC